MASVTTIQRPAEITINVSDLSVAKDISRLLKRVSGITNIRVKKTITRWNLLLRKLIKVRLSNGIVLTIISRRYYQNCRRTLAFSLQ